VLRLAEAVDSSWEAFLSWLASQLEAMAVFKSSFALHFSTKQSRSLLFTATHKFLQQLQLVAVRSADQRNAGIQRHPPSRRFSSLPPTSSRLQ